jgi:hypothetical protein
LEISLCCLAQAKECATPPRLKPIGMSPGMCLDHRAKAAIRPDAVDGWTSSAAVIVVIPCKRSV